ncbi:NAD(P)-dependent dehydrogenase, short-chain alcohol dehydrogenase family [Pseudarcicella hirudinis]|uniref:NAD(P)-dependent dehydrogenase, short-chain alcohol dehydrogenase family n=1 Tax=Pseudarcicella hirudinis TaxID=1079859 RepID=A0A1I5ME07_9BACT|nr:SDR family oxidoreductase [Pseudarcicella hirudinis]SFP07832.1 NAD(P)-dependent dehydrogenase, short-chain alcohol dehydrogenase family [Pseudarcicella hirudinis]
MDLQLKHKTALVTGSTAGIGFTIAKQLLQEGAKVIINGRTRERVDAAIKSLKELVPGASVTGVVADFAKIEEINSLLKEVPSVDILINNAGIFEPKEFVEITDEDWFRFFEINVMSGVRLSRHYFPGMLANNFGRIIFISSESSVNIPEEMIHYGVSKTAQLAVSRGLAELTKGSDVTVNSILPGPTKSEGVTGFLEELAAAQNSTSEQVEKDFFKNGRPSSLIQRFASTEEVANLVTYVSSPLSSATNGAALRVDGGVVKSII